MRMCAENEHDRVTDRLLSRVSAENYITAFFGFTKRGMKTVKRPMGRPRNRTLKSDGQAEWADKENVKVAPVHVPADAEELTRACH